MNKYRIAAFLKRVPWLSFTAQYVWRFVFQPWVTAGVVGVVLNDAGQLLLVEHVFHPKYPWGLPGGWMGRSEDPDETIRREVREETGMRIQVIRPLLVMRSRFVRRHLDMAYLCYAPPDAGHITLSEELLSYRWLDPAEVLRQYRMIYFHRLVIETALNASALKPEESMRLPDGEPKAR